MPPFREADYANPETGVSFQFELLGDAGTRSTRDVSSVSPAAVPALGFTLNFYRPRFFALEAALEIEALCAAFDLEVLDPQDDGDGPGPFDGERFVRGWEAANRRAAWLGVTQGFQMPRPVPGAELEAGWRWNLEREDRRAGHGGRVFVPRIFHLEVDGRVETACAWTDAVPIALPVVDRVVLVRLPGRLRRVLGARARMSVVPWSEVAAVVEEVASAEGGAADLAPWPHRLLDYAEGEAPDGVRRLFAAHRGGDDTPKVLASHALMDAEMFPEDHG